MKTQPIGIIIAALLALAACARAGNLGVEGNMSVASNLMAQAVTLGGETKTNWPSGGGASYSFANTNTAAGVVSTNGAQVLIGTNAPSAMPPGAVQWFAMTNTPVGWLECNGAAISRTNYAALFAAIGTTFGAGNGSNTFNLPELRGEFFRGWDHGRGVDTNRVFGPS